ncbi:methyl-accepting chemotaxis protein [Skermanella stibiiresistens]|nr:HAMP domain-containing methyl-accepting chemotaxis protein [Skermanella stibiiresistens]
MLALFRRSFAVQALAQITILLIALAAVTIVGLSTMSRNMAREELADRARLLATIVSGGSGEMMWNMDNQAAVGLLGALASDRDYVYSRLTVGKGEVFASHGDTGNAASDLVVESAPVMYGAGDKRKSIGTLELAVSPKGVFAKIAHTTDRIVLVGAIALVCLLLAFTLILRRITRPIEIMTTTMTALADGDTAAHIPATRRLDEIGRMAKAVATFRDNAIAKIQLEMDRERLKREAEIERRQSLRMVAASFESEVSGVLGLLGTTASAMTSSASVVQGTADDNNSLSGAASVAADRVSANVQTVAAAVEQLAASIREIASRSLNSHTVSIEAARRAQDAVEKVKNLVGAASRIGDVVTLINSIAAQTNLLALNATIEAARAGDAGKGFVVVANEVKQLAAQTARATGEISQHIGAIQASTGGTAADITEVANIIGSVSQISSVIAAAVEQQNAATSEISRAVTSAAQGTQELQENVRDVASSAERNGAAAVVLMGSIHSLQQSFDTLQSGVRGFVSKLEAA